MTEFPIEIREQAGREPTLYGTLLQEGRAAAGGRAELFTLGAIEWPGEGVGVATEHHGAIEVRGHVIRGKDGRLDIQARATDAIRKAYAAGKRFLSIEFQAISENTTAGGVREVTRAFVGTAAMVHRPEFSQATAEVRSSTADIERRALAWL